MNKQDFLSFLRHRLDGLPEEDIQKQCQYYSEMIDDRIEDGMTEEDAIAGIDLPEQLPMPKKQHQPLPVWAIILLVLGAPIWFSLLIAAASVVLSVYITLWSVVITLYTVPVTLGACAVAGVSLCIKAIVTGSLPLALTWLGTGLTCTGFCMFSFYLCNLAAKGTVKLSKWIFLSICSLFKRKEMS